MVDAHLHIAHRLHSQPCPTFDVNQLMRYIFCQFFGIRRVWGSLSYSVFACIFCIKIYKQPSSYAFMQSYSWISSIKINRNSLDSDHGLQFNTCNAHGQNLFFCILSIIERSVQTARCGWSGVRILYSSDYYQSIYVQNGW